ncbi:MAG: PKD domain-containing protein [Candidatus Bipolaricaulota bacterium]|nr:PKD domain-containing protein [Candidatus Bipolaricaulota bacterium]
MRRLCLVLGIGLGLVGLFGCTPKFTPKPPQALFALRPTEGVAPLTVVCDGSLSFSEGGRIAEYIWDFGDGTRGFGPIVSHTYRRGGTYRVTLTVYDERGLKGSREAQVTVRFPKPQPDFSFAPPLPATYETLRFDASASQSPNGRIVRYLWAFGDGTSAEGPVVEKSYRYGGAYVVTLSVVDEVGEVASVSKTVTVLGGPSCGR